MRAVPFSRPKGLWLWRRDPVASPCPRRRADVAFVSRPRRVVGAFARFPAAFGLTTV